MDGAPFAPEPTVLLWTAWLDDLYEGPAGLDHLDDEERLRASRFRFEIDRRRFIARRAFRRQVLATHLSVPEVAVRFRTGRWGRPEVHSRHGVTFSASHADGLAIVVIATAGTVGVDIERLRPIPGVLDLAAGVLSRREAKHIRTAAAGGPAQAFLRVWTRKEAYAKALGLGLALPFDGFDAHADPADSSIRIAPIEALPGYVGAIAVSRPDVRIRGGAGQARAA
jgi:4'-phosphopantetheinyl transferase